MAAVHLCHARGCTTRIPPRLFMCGPHWRKVPAGLRREIRQHYRPGQERDKRPSAAYLDAAGRAVAAVAATETGATP
mgnify:CR=1 FL=1